MRLSGLGFRQGVRRARHASVRPAGTKRKAEGGHHDGCPPLLCLPSLRFAFPSELREAPPWD